VLFRSSLPATAVCANVRSPAAPAPASASRSPSVNPRRDRKPRRPRHPGAFLLPSLSYPPITSSSPTTRLSSHAPKPDQDRHRRRLRVHRGGARPRPGPPPAGPAHRRLLADLGREARGRRDPAPARRRRPVAALLRVLARGMRAVRRGRLVPGAAARRRRGIRRAARRRRQAGARPVRRFPAARPRAVQEVLRP